MTVVPRWLRDVRGGVVEDYGFALAEVEGTVFFAFFEDLGDELCVVGGVYLYVEISTGDGGFTDYFVRETFGEGRRDHRRCLAELL